MPGGTCTHENQHLSRRTESLRLTGHEPSFIHTPSQIEVGRTGCIPGPPSLRTVRPVFPDTALQLVVLPPRGLTNRVVGCCQVVQPTFGKEGFPSFHSVSRAVNMRSVQTHGLVLSQRLGIAPACLVVDTRAGVVSMNPVLPHPPSCVPLLHGRYPASSLLRTL